MSSVPRVQESQSASDVGSRRYVCTTGINLYRILALTDKLSTERITAADDDDRDRPLPSTDARRVTSPQRTTCDVIRSRDYPRTGRQRSGEYVSADDRVPPSTSPGYVDQYDDAELNSEEVLMSMTSTQQNTIPPAPAASQLCRHRHGADSRRRGSRPGSSLLMSYRAYSARVFRGAPKLVCYGDDETPPSPAPRRRQTSEPGNLQSTSTSTASTSSSLDTSTAARRRRADKQLRRGPRGFAQSTSSSPAVVEKNLYDKASQVTSSKCREVDRGAVLVPRSSSFSRQHHVTTDSSELYQSCRQADSLCDDVTSGHLTIGDGRSSTVARKKRGKETLFTVAHSSGVSPNDNTETQPRRETTSGDVIEVGGPEVVRDVMLRTTDGVAAEGRPTTHTGEAVLSLGKRTGPDTSALHGTLVNSP